MAPERTSFTRRKEKKTKSAITLSQKQKQQHGLAHSEGPGGILDSVDGAIIARSLLQLVFTNVRLRISVHWWQ